jgi:hypothetical protein
VPGVWWLPPTAAVNATTCGCAEIHPTRNVTCACYRPVLYPGEKCRQCKKGWHLWPD